MLIVKEDKIGAVFEIQPWVEGDQEKHGVAFGYFGYKFVCSCISGPKEILKDIDVAKELALTISCIFYIHEIQSGYDPHPPYRLEQKMADMLRLQKYGDGKNMFEVKEKIPPANRSYYRHDVIY